MEEGSDQMCLECLCARVDERHGGCRDQCNLRRFQQGEQCWVFEVSIELRCRGSVCSELPPLKCTRVGQCCLHL